MTDNIIGGEVIPPKSVVRHDEDDYYLVVAADKGTATFSDIANEISLEYGHWLGDAFASGGSVGYDHKKMGITARGAWESVKRHFREIGVNCQTTDFTCVGIGDMAGDVFGNGMLLSEHTQLVGAFNHMHIFIDPTPNAAKSFVERKRLFELPGSSWDDYNRELISQGGGIFLRSAKSIKLSPEIQTLLGTDKASMAPNELIKALLCLNVDLLWNGGIGTYVKSSRESDAEVGDRSNDVLRVNGRDLRARIVGEGGNLGFTQLGRVEYASQGGRINTDFTDNVGGVDCSDNEVNIKILLNQLVAAGDLTLKQRNQMLYEMTDDVAQIVITNAYRQSQSISVTSFRGAEQLKEQQRFIQGLEREGKLDRALEFLPSDEELSERMAAGQGLTRPELAVLVAYGKMVLKEQLNCPEVTDEPFLANMLVTSFPAKLQQQFGAALAQHPLRGEIIATRVANMLVNDMGLNFASRMKDETGASVAEVACCFAMAREVFGLNQLWRDIEGCDNLVGAETQLELMFYSRRIVRRATRWFLRARNRSWSISEREHRLLPPGLRDAGSAPLRGDGRERSGRAPASGRGVGGQASATSHRPSGSPHEQPLLQPGSGADRRGAQDRHPACRQRLLPSRRQAGSALVPRPDQPSTGGQPLAGDGAGLLPRRSGLAAAQPHFRGAGRVQRSGRMRYHTGRLDFGA